MGYELATSVHFKHDITGKRPFLQTVGQVIDAGFKNLDFNFLDMVGYESEFLSDNYQEWIYQCKEFAEGRGAKWVQAHAVATGAKEDYGQFKKNIKRSIECCSYLGIEWIVAHHICDPKYMVDSNLTPLDFNLKMFDELLETAEKYKVGIAIENNTSFPFFADADYKDSTENLLTLVDRLGSPYAGVCWDVGHANINCVYAGAEFIAKQSEQLKIVGKRLKATHIHDNNSGKIGMDAGLKANELHITPSIAFDEHIQPYMGTVDWDDVIKGLDEIGYEHYFTYEAHRAINSIPDDFMPETLMHLRKLGEMIVSKSTLRD